MQNKPKGQAETPFILSLMIFVAFIIFIGGLLATRYPNAQLMTGFDFVFFAGSLIAVAGTCAIATGLPCLGALAFFGFSSFFAVSNTIVATLIFTPLLVTVAYVVARLSKGGG